jgi:hypothetical protein
MDQWLADGLRALAKLSIEERELLRVKFRRTLKNNLEIFGQHAFRKHREGATRRGLLNASLFDVMSCYFANISEGDASEYRDEIRQAFYELMGMHEFEHVISYSPNTPKQVHTRFELSRVKLNEVFDAHSAVS